MRSNRNERGNSYDRRRRKEWLLQKFGDGLTCKCAHCGDPLTAATLTVDRIVPGAEGGRYVRGNIQPACSTCNSSQGGFLGNQRKVA